MESKPVKSIYGAKILELKRNDDVRGSLTEVYRGEWENNPQIVQWNLVYSTPDSIRGFHVHLKRTDYLVSISGNVFIAVKDLRKESPTFEKVYTHTFKTGKKEVIIIPPGVAHGFYYPGEATLLYGLSNYWSMDDEFGCVWNDPELGIPWPTKNPKISDRDRNEKGYRELLALVETLRIELK